MSQTEKRGSTRRLSAAKKRELALRLAKYSAVAGAAITQNATDVAPANAAVIHTQHDRMVAVGSESLLDIDGDGVSDLQVSNLAPLNYTYTLPTITVTPHLGNANTTALYAPITLPTITITPNYNHNTSALRPLVQGGGILSHDHALVDLLSPATVINDQGIYGSVALGALLTQEGYVGGSLLPPVGSQLVGFKFRNASGVHFGSVQLRTLPDSLDLLIISSAYESIPGLGLTAGAAVPEPGSMALLAMGAAGLLAFRQRRKAVKA